MNLNLGIIDQQVRALAERFEDQFAAELNITDENRRISAAFVLLVVKTFLDVSEDQAFEMLTEGGGDFGVDAIEVSPVLDGEFAVTLFQGKYKRDLEGTGAFPENGVTKAIQAVGTLFDPNKQVTLNQQLLTRVEEIRSLIRDGNIPNVRVVFANNGPQWTAEAQKRIDSAGFGSQVTWQHVNHDSIVAILQSTKVIDTTLSLRGKALVDDFDFRRVLIGKIRVSILADLFEEHGDRLLERNIRRYLGLQGNRVNEGIAHTLRTPDEQRNFYFYNNGVTIVCSQFQYNALQGDNWQVRVSGMQVINGGQTCRTIQQVVRKENVDPGKAEVLVRIYELPRGEDDLVRNVTYATNSQNPVDLRDLRSNDERQKALELSIEKLGYTYRRQRHDSSTGRTDITSATVAEAVLAVWREKPHQAKFMSGEHFGKLYEKIFDDSLNGAQAITATLLFRLAENRRKRPAANAPQWLPYGSYFIAMLMGRYLLEDLDVSVKKLDHRRFTQARELIESNGPKYYQRALRELKKALKALYGSGQVSLQQLSATFRRGDLIEKLNQVS
jgi:hypothetical protein